jgi:Ni,Fe-hydrogenase III component G
MRKTPYDAEKVLQKLVGDHPEVLRGEDSGDADGGWVLVRREAPIAEDLRGGSTWALDHLFLDAAGVPTLVEVKRSSDSRIRREVVGQILDYAANAATSWTVDGLKGWLAKESGTDPDLAVAEALEGVEDTDAFWETVHTNLAAGHLRLVFVADEIPSSLRQERRIVGYGLDGTRVALRPLDRVRRARVNRMQLVERLRTPAAL